MMAESDKSSSGNHELSILVSYCQLYQAISSEVHESKSKERESKQFWEEDEWSEHEKQSAECMLSSNLGKCMVPTQRRPIYDQIATKSWDKFYNRHGTKFFHDRHYLANDFPNEFGPTNAKQQITLVEIGCGVGNNILPLLEQYPDWKFYAYDVSAVAIQYLHKDSRCYNHNQQHIQAGVWDVTVSASDSFPPPVIGNAHICTVFFCLSAISPGEPMRTAVKNIVSTLRSNGGVIILRDYGRYDESQLKLGTQRAKRLGENWFVKADGTRCYYFSLEDLRDLFVGLDILELRYICRKYHNHVKKQKRRRVWVQARFQLSTR
jgi:SAM-dependent methyltransferase